MKHNIGAAGYTGSLNAATLDELAGHYAALRRAAYDEAQRSTAWQAIMLTYPDLLAAARIGLGAEPESSESGSAEKPTVPLS